VDFDRAAGDPARLLVRIGELGDALNDDADGDTDDGARVGKRAPDTPEENALPLVASGPEGSFGTADGALGGPGSSAR
jgi:hypothetical protein